MTASPAMNLCAAVLSRHPPRGQPHSSQVSWEGEPSCPPLASWGPLVGEGPLGGTSLPALLRLPTWSIVSMRLDASCGAVLFWAFAAALGVGVAPLPWLRARLLADGCRLPASLVPGVAGASGRRSMLVRNAFPLSVFDLACI